jgi:hypothetical protein
MVEAFIPVAIASITGVAALAARLNHSIHLLDRRIDEVELRVAEQYVTKADMSLMFGKMEDWMIRIEEKIDRISR